MSGIETAIGTVTPGHFRPEETDRPRSCVLGPKFLYALYNPEEAFHGVAYAFLRFVRDERVPYRRFVLNEHIINEAATRLKKRAGMAEATAFLDAVADSEYFVIEQLSEEMFQRVRTRFHDWDDNDASFTDFAIGVQMEAMDLHHIMTFDSDLGLFDVRTYPPVERA
jgi:predicted nucleic acid-binding protein